MYTEVVSQSERMAAVPEALVAAPHVAIPEPSHDLFRREALHGRSGEGLGVIRLATPLSHRLWTLASLVIGACIVGWLFLGHYTRRERVDGILLPQQGLLTVTSRAAGTVKSLSVSEGASVREGDALLTLSSERSSVALGDTAANISAQLQQQKKRLESDLADTRHMADQQANDFRMQQSMLEGQLQQLDAQISIERRRAASITEILMKIQPLVSSGYVSRLEVQQEESQEMEAESQIRSLTKERYETKRQLLGVVDQLAQLPLTTQAKISDIQKQVAQTQQSLNSNEADRETVNRAPYDGVISSVQIKAGQSVTAGQTLLAVVPNGSTLQAELWVPTKAIGFVRVGTRVSLHYQAFPYQKFGVQHGTVISISRSALTPSEVTTLMGEEPPKEPMFRVDVALDMQSISAYGHQEPLRPSMSVDADLLLDKRPVIEWIFEPLYGAGRRFFGRDA